MSFSTLMYHELRLSDEFNPKHPSAIDVRQDYEDVLPPPLFTTAEAFMAQMAYLQEREYSTLTLDDIKSYYTEGKSLPERSVLLTFDDCFQSLKTYAYPILKEYGFHAVAFVVSGWLHAEPKPFDPLKSTCLATDELDEISDVFEFANHTHHFHQRRGTDASKLTLTADEEFRHDLLECNKLPQLNSRDVFAYPFGLYESRNVEVLKQSGFTLAFTTEQGLNDRGTDPLRLKRNVVPYFMDLDAFARIL
ncbi:polysaccharide deacetylase family protein [Paenibacillus sp. CAU 1782]